MFKSEKSTAVSDLGEQFCKFKNDLYNSNYYTFNSMIEKTINALKEYVYFNREI